MAYTSIEIEGALFPSDLLDRIATGEADGQRVGDFGLPGGSRLSEEVQGAFSDVRAYWEAFQRRLARSKEAATTVTREAWVVPLLERLGFQPRYQGSAEIEGDTFVISHRLFTNDDAPPLSIVAAGQDLDRRSEGSRRSPHAALQEYLNRSDQVWGLLTNGEKLRLVRDAARLSRPTYLEIDLRTIIEANLYSEFVLLYRLLHRSRWPSSFADASASLLERYYQQGIDEGSRVREHLRDGVEVALRELGTTFVSHPANEALRASLRQGTLTQPAFYRQLLRLVYRMLFLMVIEERRLIFPPGLDQEGARNIYSRYYSLTALRQRAEVPTYGYTNLDLWQGLLCTFGLFRDTAKAAQLGLAAMNGELFAPEACQALEESECTNASLLSAVLQLSTFAPGAGLPRRRVNYAGLDVEELGSVYESLLEFRPQVVLDGAPRFELVSGSERRQTGSYYTPPNLVKELIDGALMPRIVECLAASSTAGAEAALLSLRICDLASGSGHFLLEAARRLARELARARTREDEPAPVAYRAALRDVIRTCVYAVDKNPLAVDLCKVALWIEGHSAGLPLSFLDHHVKHGDSLIGLGPDIDIEAGILSQAYERADIAQKPRARLLRQRNTAERASGQLTLPGEVRTGFADLADSFGGIAILPDDSISSVSEKSRRYAAARASGSTWWAEETAAHLWTSAFFADLRDESVPTTGSLRAFRANPDRYAQDAMVSRSWALAGAPEHPFFHWSLEFPEVLAGGGFDVVLSNPPFMGGLKISSNFGLDYRRFLIAAFAPAAGTADLCAFFFRRAFSLLRSGGRLGMIGTKTIHEGDTREAALKPIVEAGGVIASARRSVPWPGEANVQIDLVAIARGGVGTKATIDGVAVGTISSRLDDEPETEALVLSQNEGKAFIGSYVLGLGFVLTTQEAERLIVNDARNGDCLFPYLTGEDLNSRADQSPSRWVINFDERSESEAQMYPDLWQIVSERVRPERLLKDPSDQRAVMQWWKHYRTRPELHRATQDLSKVLVRSRVSELHLLAFVPRVWTYSEQVVAFAFDDDYHFGLLQSSAHEAWVRRYSSHLESRSRYTPTDCFDNFPFPQHPSRECLRSAERAAHAYDQHRAAVMKSRDAGLTETYNLVNDAQCSDGDIVRLRALHAGLDDAVLACYGWSDVALAHQNYKNERAQDRFTISPDARREVLHRLLALNAEVAGQQRQQTAEPRRKAKT
ncbi:MAG: type IIL restriction-modification enzyme MmeI [Chloroflexota bacterium]